jgi:uncharacterized protein (DUF1697 family)
MSNKPCLCLLRGINVGGNNIIKMEDLKKTFEEMQCAGVKTYIQSGNVIFFSDGQAKEQLLRTIEQTLSKKYGYEARAVLLTLAEMRTVIAGIPAEWEANPGEYRCDVWFVRRPATVADLMRSVKTREGVDQVRRGRTVMYAWRLTRLAGKTYFTKIIQEPVYQNITIRNWNTAKKLLDLMEAMVKKPPHSGRQASATHR